MHKVLIDGNQRAYGVQFDRNGRTKTVNASREVILSAGAVGSPQILMLSGIGPKEHLKQLNVIFIFLISNLIIYIVPN